jgi:leader peptidase (prepilin peptidase)/N-methyltransferase
MTAGLDAWIVPLTDAVIVIFLVALGANLGSFLNVVVHRLPRGESVVRGGSRCPSCGAAIRWHDNVPVVGWLALGGRCRDCRRPISPRYPLVEAAAAAIVGAVASVELLSGGRNLPGEMSLGRRAGGDLLILNPDWWLIAACALHCAVLVTLLAWALLDRDGQPVPTPWLVAAMAIMVVAAVALPGVQPVGAGFGPQQGPLRQLVGSAAGIVVGGVVGRLLGGRTAAAMLAVVGAALGWQAALATAAIAAIVHGVRRLSAAVAGPSWRPAGIAADILVAAVAHQIGWRFVHQGWRLIESCIVSALGGHS